jgi:DNA-binding GntR family transcriptional regulator
VAKIIRLSLHQEVAERIQARIISQQLLPGTRIDEQALAEEFGISRTPLREALKVLQAEGLVTLVPRRGCFVARLSDRDLDDIYAIVALVEARCAAAIAAGGNAEDLKRLEALHEQLERAAAAGDVKRYSQANASVHEALLEIGGNRWQKRIVHNLRRMLTLSHRPTIGFPGRLQHSIAEHREIMAAIAARDAARAERAMTEHMMQQRRARMQQGEQEAAG